jgi:hypothetical protein
MSSNAIYSMISNNTSTSSTNYPTTYSSGQSSGGQNINNSPSFHFTSGFHQVVKNPTFSNGFIRIW